MTGTISRGIAALAAAVLTVALAFVAATPAEAAPRRDHIVSVINPFEPLPVQATAHGTWKTRPVTVIDNPFEPKPITTAPFRYRTRPAPIDNPFEPKPCC